MHPIHENATCVSSDRMGKVGEGLHQVHVLDNDAGRDDELHGRAVPDAAYAGGDERVGAPLRRGRGDGQDANWMTIDT